MQAMVKLLNVALESSSYETAEFKSLFTKLRNLLKKEFNRIGATDVTFNKLHFGMSGFFKVNEQWFYFSFSDFRSVTETMLIRTAKDNTDYSGGSNHYLLVKDFSDSLDRFISNP